MVAVIRFHGQMDKITKQRFSNCWLSNEIINWVVVVFGPAVVGQMNCTAYKQIDQLTRSTLPQIHPVVNLLRACSACACAAAHTSSGESKTRVNGWVGLGSYWMLTFSFLTTSPSVPAGKW